MPGRLGTALAIGAAVAAELVLGVLLVITGGGAPEVVNPWRVGDGFPQPPPCSMIDRSRVAALLGGAVGETTLEDSYFVEDNDPSRRCVFTTPRSRFTSVEVTMRSRLGNHGSLEITNRGLSDLTMSDNLSTKELKRISDYVSAGFQIDNLVVGCYHTRPGIPGRELPDEETARRMRDDMTALVHDITGKLTPRNRTTPTNTR
ncbi:MAG TPA: hypothetical protein VGX25_16255 [Actinophytocola sp.]|uniref:hypothetical protein n=1 Tax=Actinophytocola sp. TaxID=1872138 RepID=UPI002DDCDDF4|nr:hypothetical protein [Actinophytocola sp.]HEV2780937.1 hypothetical protein [Actinophytocola sp.]